MGDMICAGTPNHPHTRTGTGTHFMSPLPPEAALGGDFHAGANSSSTSQPSHRNPHQLSGPSCPQAPPLPATLCGVSTHQALGAAELSPSNQELTHSSALLPTVAPFPPWEPDQWPFLEKRLTLVVQALPVSPTLLSATYPCNPRMPTDPNRGPSDHTQGNETPHTLCTSVVEACCRDQAPPQHLETTSGEKGAEDKEPQLGRACLTPQHRMQKPLQLPSIPAAPRKSLCQGRGTSAPGNREAAPAPQGDA